MARGSKNYPETPDGRYFVSKGKLWRTTNPHLEDSERRLLIKRLMQARRAVFQAGEDAAEVQAARDAVHAAKVALGERGPVWWDDGAPDETGKSPRSSRYAEWWDQLSSEERARGLYDKRK